MRSVDEETVLTGLRLDQPFVLPPEQRKQRTKAIRLKAISIVVLAFAAFLVYLTLGQSQAMKTAWVSDLLALIPPIAFLIASRFEFHPPTQRFAFGYFRAMSVAFLITAIVLLIIGLWLLFDGVMTLVNRERPAIGTIVILGRQVWLGFAMMAALATTVAMSLVLGRFKTKLADKLHSKVLEADAAMNRANWMAEGAAVIGIGLVGFGYWWGDAVAAVIISLNIIHDGWHNLKQVLGDMMDENPTRLGSQELEDLPARIRAAAERLDWVREAAVRLREQGHVVSGEVFVVPHESKSAGRELTDLIGEASAHLRTLDWRLYSLTISPVSSIDSDTTPEAGA